MIPLPAALEPWRSKLSLFPEDLALSVGELASRLALLVGPMRRTRARESGDLDGYAGIDRRGSYERLLTSEWLLAEEAPDEFLRRAAMGEHAFLAPARQESAGIHACTALFDAGPWQLGTPRIAHAALLIVLAQRAEEAGVPFRWGILQEPEAQLMEEVSRASILRLVEARTTETVDTELVTKWQERVRADEVDDLWIVGNEGISAPRETSQVVVRDVLEPGRSEVEVEVRAPHRAPRAATLELPNRDDCIRLLRDPFSAIRAPALVKSTSLTIDPHGPLRFLVRQNRLLVGLEDGRFAALHFPGNTRAAPGKPIFVRSEGTRIVAVGWRGKSLGALRANDDEFFVDASLAEQRWKRTGVELSFLKRRPAELFHGAWKGAQALFVRDSAMRLYAFAPGRPEPELVMTGVMAMAYRSHGLVAYAGPSAAQPGIHLLGSSGFVHRGSLAEGASGEVYFGPEKSGAPQLGARLLLRTSVLSWIQYRWADPVAFSVPENLEVVGLTTWAGDETRVVARVKDRPELVLYDVGGRTDRLYTAPAPITQAACAPNGSFIAFLTKDGRAFVIHSDGTKLLEAGPAGIA